MEKGKKFNKRSLFIAISALTGAAGAAAVATPIALVSNVEAHADAQVKTNAGVSADVLSVSSSKLVSSAETVSAPALDEDKKIDKSAFGRWLGEILINLGRWLQG